MKNKNYFDKTAEKAVVDYVTSKDESERHDIYINRILPVFDKLVENIIFKYDFLHLTNNYEDLHHEVMTHLYMNLDKFNPKYGSKAYSYFGTTAKRYLQQKSITKTFENKNIEDIHKNEKDELNDNMMSRMLKFEDEEKNDNDKEFINILIKHFESKDISDKNEKKIIESIIYFLKNYESINIHNKKHAYLLIREYTGLDTKAITRILNKYISDDYNILKEKYINFRI